MGLASIVEFMASTIKVTPQKEKIPENKVSETPPDRPVLDPSDTAVKELIRTAKKRGYVTHDQINALLASEEVNSEQIESILAKFSEMGINVVEAKQEARLAEEVTPREEPEGEETEGESSELVEIQQRSAPAKAPARLSFISCLPSTAAAVGSSAASFVAADRARRPGSTGRQCR